MAKTDGHDLSSLVSAAAEWLEAAGLVVVIILGARAVRHVGPPQVVAAGGGSCGPWGVDPRPVGCVWVTAVMDGTPGGARGSTVVHGTRTLILVGDGYVVMEGSRRRLASRRRRWWCGVMTLDIRETLVLLLVDGYCETVGRSGGTAKSDLVLATRAS